MAAYHAYSKEIDNDVLIEEVKARPALYDRKVKEYADQVFKKAMWEEINEKLFPDVWHEMTETQKEIRATEVLKRWNNLRTCFTRELKIMKDPLQQKRRKYVYFNKLMFILDENSPQYQELESSGIFERSNSSFLDKDDDDTTLFPEKIQAPIELKSIKKIKKTRLKQMKIKEGRKKDVEKYVQYSINKLKEELAFKNRTEDNMVLQVDSVPKTFDTDADTNFALSLVPTLKNIPLHKKIDAQIDILNILKKYTSKIACEYVIKYEKEDEQSSEAEDMDDDSEILSMFGDEK